MGQLVLWPDIGRLVGCLQSSQWNSKGLICYVVVQLKVCFQISSNWFWIYATIPMDSAVVAVTIEPFCSGFTRTPKPFHRRQGMESTHRGLPGTGLQESIRITAPVPDLRM